MLSIKTNKIKKTEGTFLIQFLMIYNFAFGPVEIPHLQRLKCTFFFEWVVKQIIAYEICNVVFWHSPKDKAHFKDL